MILHAFVLVKTSWKDVVTPVGFARPECIRERGHFNQAPWPGRGAVDPHV